MSAIPLPTAQPARDPVAEPWLGDIWQKGPRARRLLGFHRRESCAPYRSYGRTLSHCYRPVEGPGDATHVEIGRLLAVHAPKQTTAARRNLTSRTIGGVPFKRTSSSKITLSAWSTWLQGAQLIQSGPNPEPLVPPQIARKRFGVLLETRDGDETTWTFEWGKIVRTRKRGGARAGSSWEADVLVGGVPVGTWQLPWGTDVLDVCWGYAHGILTAVRSLDASDHEMIRLGLADRQVIRPDFRRPS